MVLSKDLDTPSMNIKNIIGLVIIENPRNVKNERVLFTSAFVKFAVMILCESGTLFLLFTGTS